MQHQAEDLASALRRCETEPIHQLGLIQPHGALLVVNAASPHLIERVSANVFSFFSLPQEQLSGASLVNLLGVEQTADVEVLFAQCTNHSFPSQLIYSVVNEDILELQVTVHPQASTFVLEFELVSHLCQPADTLTMFESVNKATGVLESIDNVPAYCEVVADLVRHLSHFERVMVYRFDANWDGEVIAESRRSDVRSYLGNRFPAGDIPPQARQLYTQNLLRVVCDVEAQPVPVISVNSMADTAALPLDLSLSVLRAFSPVHVEYLKNMGVRASLSISIILDGKLWGLIACHHDAPILVAHPVREMLRFVGKMIGMKLAALDAQQRLLQGNRLGETLTILIREVYGREDHYQALHECSGRILDLVGASGAVLLIDAQPCCFGLVPEAGKLEALLEWLRGQNHQGTLASNYLAEIYPAAAQVSIEVAGLLATPLAAGGRNGMLWFRRERLRTIEWAGRPEKQVVSDAHGDWRISPRKSFASWQEIWRGRSDDWTAQEISSAEVLAQTLIEAMVQKGLKQRDEFYRLFGDQTPEMIARLAPDGSFTYVSPTAYMVLGKRPAELLGSSMLALIEEADQSDFMQKLSDASDEMSSAVFRMHNAGSQQIWLEVNIKRVKRANGEPELIAISRDVSERQKFLLATEEFQQLNQTLLEAEGEGVVAVDCSGAVIYCNPRACELLGWSAEELLGKNAHSTLHHSRPDGSSFPVGDCPTSVVLRSGETSLCHDDFYIHRNGSVLSVLTATTPIVDQGEISGALVVFIHAGQADTGNSLITEEHIGAIMTLDADGLITSFSDSLARLTGYSIREMVGKSPSLLKSNVHTRSFFRELWSTLKEDKHWQGLIWNRCQDGSIRPFWLSMNAVCDRAGAITQYVAIYGEATPKSSPEAQLQFLASHDNLTGLPNRAQLSRRLRQAIARANRLGCMLAVAFIDLDHFKMINDTLGHDVGDTYLTEVARRLASNCREEDTLARWGGDEFVLLMEDVQQTGDPLLFAQRLVASLTETVKLSGQPMAVSASIGLAMYPDDAQTTGSLIQAADRAMYEAKTLGRNRIVQYRDTLQPSANQVAGNP